MDERQILLTIDWLPIISACLAYGLMLTLVRCYHPEQLFIEAYDELSGLVKERSKKMAWYQRSMIWLERNGGSFHYGKWVNPLRFMSLRFVLAAICLWAFSTWRLEYGLLACVVSYMLPTLLLQYLNGQDNVKMLPEIKLIYHALEMQIRGGVYVTDAMAECYGSVKEKRLRQALLELAGDIVMKADVYEALNRFQGKFDNRYVDSLCITLSQALESGQAVELLSDISEQIKDMEMTLLERKKAALDRRITFYQLGILAAVLGVVLYACANQMLTAAIGF